MQDASAVSCGFGPVVLVLKFPGQLNLDPRHQRVEVCSEGFRPQEHHSDTALATINAFLELVL